MLNQRRILSKIVHPACIPVGATFSGVSEQADTDQLHFDPVQDAQPGHYIAYWEAFPPALAKNLSSRWTLDLALQTTNQLAQLSVPLRVQNVLTHPREKATVWIKMVARIMAIGSSEWNERERERSTDIHLVVLGPVSWLPLHHPSSLTASADADLAHLLLKLALLPMKPNVNRIMRDHAAVRMEANTPHHMVMLQAGIDWATLETPDYLLNRDSFGVQAQQRKLGLALQRALQHARLRMTPYFGRDNYALVRVKRHVLTSAVIVHRARLFPKIPRFSWILYNDRHSGSDNYGALVWGLVHETHQTTSGKIHELVVSVRRDIEAWGADGKALSNLLEGMRPSKQGLPRSESFGFLVKCVSMRAPR